MKFYVEHNILFNTIRDLLQQLNLESSFAIPKEEDVIKYIQKHREILIDKIKQYGNYENIDINNLNEINGREKVIKKYIWLLSFHRSICGLYELPEYDVV